MSDAKKLREDEESSDDEEDDMELVVEEEVNIDFEGFTPSDEDSSGIRLLLLQLFSQEAKINIPQLADAIISQNFIGTVLKQSESLSNDSTDDDSAEDVYGIVTCYSLTRPQDDVTKSLFDHLLSKCKGSKMADENRRYFEKVLDAGAAGASGACLGFIINERFVNVPPQASRPMFEKLTEEISTATSRRHKSSFDFSHYVIICKVYAESPSKSGQSGGDLYVNAEEELFSEQSLVSFDYKISVDDDVTKTRRVLLLSREGFQKAIITINECL
ncbi:unnamed protein product [Clavelina lepadiformis]|uniref:Protein BCCIP homolog n=1 Tax=Clavelina lepadiformis TaxID=159417 RepID=A0ABP0GJ40_CLALP